MDNEKLGQFTDEQLMKKVEEGYRNYTLEALNDFIEELKKRGHEVDKKLLNEINMFHKGTSSSGYVYTYKTARGIASFISFLGWVLVVIGGLAAAKTAISLMQPNYGGFYGGISAASFLTAIALAVSGFLLVMGGQVTRAAVDTADNTGRLVNLMESAKQ
jgi:hypothetical protein